LKKAIASVVVAGALTGAVGWSAAAGAATVNSSSTTTTHVHGKGRHPIVRWLRAHRRQIGRRVVVVSAKAIGITPQTLVSELRSGKSLAQVASEHGVQAQKVEDALVNAADNVINRAVANHKITPTEASKIEVRVPTAVGKLVNHQFGQNQTSSNAQKAA